MASIIENIQTPTNMAILITGVATMVFGALFRKKWVGGLLIGAGMAMFACLFIPMVPGIGTTGMMKTRLWQKQIPSPTKLPIAPAPNRMQPPRPRQGGIPLGNTRGFGTINIADVGVAPQLT